jgi:hypothetical protein
MALVIPKNREQAYGVVVQDSLDVLIEAYRATALYHDAVLPSGMAEKLDQAQSVLKELFPDTSGLDAYATADKLANSINFLFREIQEFEDSPTRRHFHAFVRARLYAGTPRTRATDLIADAELKSISNGDIDPLSLLLGESRSQIITFANGALPVEGIASDLPLSVKMRSRPHRGLDEATAARYRLVAKVNEMADMLLPLVTRHPWGSKPDAGAITVFPGNYAFGAEAFADASYEGLNSDADFVDWVASLDLQAQLDYVRGALRDRNNVGTCAFIGIRGDGNEDIEPGTQIQIEYQVRRAGQQCMGFVRTHATTPVERFRALKVSVNGGANVTLNRTGATVETLAAGAGLFIDRAEYTSGQGLVGSEVFIIRGAPVGKLTVSFSYDQAYVSAADSRDVLYVGAVPSMETADQTILSDEHVLEQVKDQDFTSLMIDFFSLRHELSGKFVNETQWLKSYHRYIIGPTAGFVDIVPLTFAQVAQIKARMLNIATWADFVNLPGFLEKLYDDLGSLRALAQSTSTR